jgi:hypothetical protein
MPGTNHPMTLASCHQRLVMETTCVTSVGRGDKGDVTIDKSPPILWTIVYVPRSLAPRDATKSVPPCLLWAGPPAPWRACVPGSPVPWCYGGLWRALK